MLRPRILFCVHDDRGLGHLVRLSRVAAGLERDCACLLVTGHRAASWIVPEGSEFVHIPSLDNLLQGRAAYWGRRPFVDIHPDAVCHLRSQLVLAVVKEFAPDAIIIDHLALGRRGELSAALAYSHARKYLLLRGVIDRPAKAMAEVFPPESLKLVDSTFSRILVACDPEICRIETEYLGAHSVMAKINYVGYVAPTFTTEARKAIRRQRGVGGNGTWIVCSAGGGMESEELIEECRRLAQNFPSVAFDVVYGPRSRRRDRRRLVPRSGNVRVWRACKRLPLFHAAADVVICRGGYNSLMEVAAGSAKAICIPLSLVDDEEQRIHATRLARWLPVHVSRSDPEEMTGVLAEILKARVGHSACPWQRTCGLDFNGVANIRRLVIQDLAGDFELTD